MANLIQDTLTHDENLAYELAQLVPVSSKIADAAATYLDKAGKRMSDDKNQLNLHQYRIVSRTCDLAQQAVKIGALINHMLRTPETFLKDETETKPQTAEEVAFAEIIEAE